MILHENELTAQQYCDLWTAVGFPAPTPEQAERALANTLYAVSVEIDGGIVGMGRLVGDGAVVVYLQEVFVHPSYQGQGVGSAVVRALLDYIKRTKPRQGSVMVGLLAAKGRESFYHRFGFHSRPNETEGCGFLMKL